MEIETEPRGKKRRIEEVDDASTVSAPLDLEEKDEDSSDSDEVDAIEYEKKTQKKIKELEVEFDVRVIEEIDFKAIRRFVTHFCLKQTFNSSELVEIICAQPEVGSVIRQLDTVETFGFITVINIFHHKDKACIKQIVKFVQSMVPKEDKRKWDKFLESPKTGLLLNERILNVPHAIAPQLHTNMFEEIQSVEQEDLPFKFDNYLYISNFGHTDKMGDTHPQKKKKSKIERNYFKAEDEVFFKHASISFTAPVSHTETRLFLIFTEEKIPQILNDIKLHVLEGYSW